MILVTTPTVPGRKITEALDIVRGNTIRTRHIGHDIKAILRHIIGGEIIEYTKLMGEAREQAMDRMIENAREIGADAIVGVDFSTSYIMGGAAEIVVYGTAVKLD